MADPIEPPLFDVKFTDETISVEPVAMALKSVIKLIPSLAVPFNVEDSLISMEPVEEEAQANLQNDCHGA
jgi:hypothetical protein